jgi:integrase/recombinase XerD
MSFSTSIVLEKRTPRKDNKYPVKLRVTIDRKSRFYGLNKYFTEKEFDKVIASKKDEYKKIKWELDQKERDAKQHLESMPKPNFDLFKVLFTSKSKGANVISYFDFAMNQCLKEGRISTGNSYECAKNSLDDIMGIAELNFRDITPQWLREYERKMKRLEKSITTIKIYLGALRTVYLKAIEDKIVSKDHFPFGENYTIPTAENNKRPLERSEVELIANYTGDPLTERYRDFFLLSYYLVGLNFADLLSIRWSQIDGNILEVLRQKTANTRRKQRKIQLVISTKARKIIDLHGNKDGIYVFDVVSPKDDPKTVRRKIKNFTRATNQALERICKAVKINKKVSTMYARHSAASHSLIFGATIADISQALGHSDLRITSKYISSLSTGKQLIAESLEISDILNIDGAARLTGLSKSTLYKKVKEGTLVATKEGKQLHFNRSDLISHSKNVNIK